MRKTPTNNGLRRRSCTDAYTLQALGRIKPIQQVIKERTAEEQAATQREHANDGPQLTKELGIMDLMGYGVGCTVGAGIYSLIGTGVKVAGPAILISFLVGAVACVFTGLAYSEFAARVPIAGSAYTYAYTSFGELLAWIIGWNLTLEYAVSAAAIARAWADYFVQFWEMFGLQVPSILGNYPIGKGFSVSILAAMIVLLCSFIMIFGIKESSRFNVIVTALNVIVLMFVVIVGAFKVDSANWTVVNDSYVPYGFPSIISGAGTVFFSYLGFDMVSSLAEEVKNPQRDMPLGIIGSLSVSSCIYVGVTLVVTGMVPFTAFASHSAPLAYAFENRGLGWASYIITCGSLFGLTTATFTCLLGQPRVFYRMATDGLLFPVFRKLSRKQVPVIGTLLTGIVTALIAFFVSLDALSDAISVGTLLAFSIVNAGVVVLRIRTSNNSYRVFGLICGFSALILLIGFSIHYAWPLWITIVASIVAFGCVVALALHPVAVLPTSFKCPLVPWIPCAGIAVNLGMMTGLSSDAWLRLLIWTILGLGLYFGYGIWNSGLYVQRTRFKSFTAGGAVSNPRAAEHLIGPEGDQVPLLSQPSPFTVGDTKDHNNATAGRTKGLNNRLDRMAADGIADETSTRNATRTNSKHSYLSMDEATHRNHRDNQIRSSSSFNASQTFGYAPYATETASVDTLDNHDSERIPLVHNTLSSPNSINDIEYHHTVQAGPPLNGSTDTDFDPSMYDS